MYKLGDFVKVASDTEVIYEVINVKERGLVYDLKRNYDVLVLKNIPHNILSPY